MTPMKEYDTQTPMTKSTFNLWSMKSYNLIPLFYDACLRYLSMDYTLMEPIYLSLTQVHLEREEQPQAKPLEEIKARLNIIDHLLVVEGLDLHPAGDQVVDLVQTYRNTFY